MADEEGKGAAKAAGDSEKAVRGTVEYTQERLKLMTEIEKMSASELQNAMELQRVKTKNLAVQGEMFVQMQQADQAAAVYNQAKEQHTIYLDMLQQSITKNQELQLQLQEAKQAKNQELIDQTLEDIRENEEKRDLLQEQNDLLDAQVAALGEATEEYRSLNDAGREAFDFQVNALQEIGSKRIGLQNAQQTMIGKTMMHTRMLMEQEGAIKGLGMAFRKVFNLQNLGATAISWVTDSFMKMFLSLDKVGAQFAAATGTGTQYRSAIEDVTRANNHLYVGMEEVGNAYKGLLDELIGFYGMNEELQQSLAGQLAQMENIGIKSEDAADAMNTFGSIMGATGQEAVDATRHLALMGTSIGISSQKMIKDFKMASQTLAVYGKRATAVFGNMAAAAKAAGVEMGDLLQIAGKFDTFESAADSVTKLNAILGTNLSTMQLNQMSEDERIETVIRSIQVSGESFSQMNKFKQMAIANAMGITDMAKANKIFGMSMSAYRAHRKEMAKSKTDQEALEKATKATADIQKQFQSLLIEFAPKIEGWLESFKTGLDNVLSGFRWLNTMTGGWFPYIVFWGGLAAMTIGIFGKVLAPVIMLGKGLKKVMGGAGDGVKEMDKSVGKSGKGISKFLGNVGKGLKKIGKAKGAAGVMMAMGFAVLMMGAGVAVAAWGVSQLVTAFMGLGPAASSAALAIGLLMIPFIAFFALMAFVIYSGVGPLTAGVMLAMGAAALMLGIGIAIAAAGLSLLVKSIGSLGADGVTAAASFLLIAQGMALMLVGMAALLIPMYFFAKLLVGTAAGAALASVGFTGLALGITATAIASVLLGLGLMVIAGGLAAIVESGGAAMGAFLGLGIGLAAMAAGVGAMFLFISNPMGWLAIAAAMGVMSGALAIFVAGINSIDSGKLEALATLSDAFKSLQGASAEATVIAKVTDDLDGFKEQMDATLMSQVTALGIFGDIASITNTKASTQVSQEMKMPDNITVQAEHTINTHIGQEKFDKAVKKSINKAKWGIGDQAPLNIVAAGNK